MNLRIFTCAALLVTSICGQSQNYNIELRSTMEFSGQTLANVWGYAQNGKEYALLGGQLGLIIVDVTNPDSPVQITQIPGPNNLWKEVKTYQHFAYVITEGGPVQVVDLSPLPDPNLPVFVYNGDGPIAGEINNVHALHVDETKGFLYLYGSGAGVSGTGGALVCDLNDDPFHPKFVGEFQTMGYIHDGYADNDTLYGGHIYAGQMSIVDMSDKANPVILGSVKTPNEFTHNTWPNASRKYALTTDEVDGSYLACYDITNPTNIVELDRFQCTPGSGSVPHNTHILNDYAITSWYTDGVSIVDASNPSNLVQVGWYDTYPEQSGGGYNGCWGVYPFLPSGNLIATNIPVAFAVGTGKMFVLTPEYVRACWLEGKVTNGLTGQTISGVTVGLNSGEPQTNTSTGLVGDFKLGQKTAGVFEVTFFKNGFEPKTVEVTLENGVITVLDVELFPPGTSSTHWLEPSEVNLQVSPTAFANSTNISFELPSATEKALLQIANSTGQVIWERPISKNTSSMVFDEAVAAGTYFVSLYLDGQQTKAVAITKTN